MRTAGDNFNSTSLIGQSLANKMSAKRVNKNAAKVRFLSENHACRCGQIESNIRSPQKIDSINKSKLTCSSRQKLDKPQSIPESIGW